MPNPTPFAVRVVRLYSGAQMLATRGITPAAPLQWPTKHPLDIDWWWVDATAWCQDISDTITSFSAANVFVSGGDGTLFLLGTTISADGKQVGMRWIGGTSGQTYTVTVVLSGSLGADTDAFDISFLCQGTVPAGLGTPWLADFSSAANSGAYPYLA